MPKSVKYAVLAMLVAALACQLGSGQAEEAADGANQGSEATDLPLELPLETRSFRMGTAGFVPAGYPEPSDQEWQSFFQTGAASYGDLYGVHLSPSAPKNADGVLEQVELAFSQVNGVEVYVALAVSHERGPFTEAVGEELVEAAVAVARQREPVYLSLGVESNSLYLFEADSFDLYLEYVEKAYQAVKEVSPDTLVMNNFQLDRMKGQSQLAGENFESHWQLIDRMAPQMDLISFTVYPFLHYQSVEAIPSDYLLEIREHTDLPVVITETGWPTKPTASGVEGSEQAQVDYLLTLAEQANQIEAEALIWVFPHDADFGIAGGIFDHISLKTNDGTPKPAFDYWRAFQQLPQY